MACRIYVDGVRANKEVLPEIIRMRGKGASWVEIGAATNKSAGSVRKVYLNAKRQEKRIEHHLSRYEHQFKTICACVPGSCEQREKTKVRREKEEAERYRRHQEYLAGEPQRLASAEATRKATEAIREQRRLFFKDSMDPIISGVREFLRDAHESGTVINVGEMHRRFGLPSCTIAEIACVCGVPL